MVVLYGPLLLSPDLGTSHLEADVNEATETASQGSADDRAANGHCVVSSGRRENHGQRAEGPNSTI